MSPRIAPWRNLRQFTPSLRDSSRSDGLQLEFRHRMGRVNARAYRSAPFGLVAAKGG